MTDLPQKRECIHLWGLQRVCINDEIIVFLKGMRGGYVEGTVISVSEYGIMLKVKDKKRMIRLSEIKMVEMANESSSS